MRPKIGDRIIINNPCNSIMHKKNAKIYSVGIHYCLVKFEEKLGGGSMRLVMVHIPHCNTVREDLYYEVQ